MCPHDGPSVLDRWLTEVQWEVTALHDRRLAWLQQAPRTRYSVRGVMALAHTLVDYEGKLSADGGWGWDHADARHVSAHDSRSSNYVCPSGAHSPIAWRRLKKRAPCAAKACKAHTHLGIEVIDAALTRGIPGDFTLDS